MRHRWSIKRRSTWALIAAPVLVLASLSIAAASAATHHNHASAPAGAAAERYVPSQYTVQPDKANMLDCNGWSKKYTAIIHGFGEHCTDPRGIALKSMVTNCKGNHGGPYTTVDRFADNCHYVGHDEPSVKFISSKPGSGYQFTYYLQLPTDPTAAPTDTGSVVHYFELSPAPWFGLPICDPSSYPIHSCKPHSDSNSGEWNNKHDAGSAFMELQFYPPGNPPFEDSVSCDATHWCAAMTIDSLEATYGLTFLNENCTEPINFAYLQRNGKPTGPPSPQKTDASSFVPNSETLEMNPGDVLKLSFTDPLTGPKAGFTATVTDLTTHQTGYMIASAHNGFMDTNYKSCAGKKFTFHAEYNTARQQNQVPWAALEGGVIMEQETGHSEVCTSLEPDSLDPTTEPGFSDPSTYDTCVGGNEGGTTSVGEGPCDATTLTCTGSQTQGPDGESQACPSDSLESGDLCEYADGTCLPAGSRSVTINGQTTTMDSPINWCQANRWQNGDLDFDGLPYQPGSWPGNSPDVPTSLRYAGPFTKGGATYPQIQFESDIPGSEFLCNTVSGAGCTVPPEDANFYPFWSLTKAQSIGTLFKSGTCIWNFGNTNPGVTLTDFGGDHEYGKYDTARPFGTNISKVLKNPELTFSGCGALRAPK